MANRIYRIPIPGVGPVGVTLFRDPGEARTASGVILGTKLTARHFRREELVEERDLGSGVITVGFVNTLVSDAVTGTSVVPTFARYIYHDSGTGVTGATDGDTGLQTAAGPSTRATGVLSNAQSATTGNHLAKLSNIATITYAGTLSITEWGLFDTSAQGTGNLCDRRTFSALNVVSGDSISWTWTVSLPSNN